MKIRESYKCTQFATNNIKRKKIRETQKKIVEEKFFFLLYYRTAFKNIKNSKQSIQYIHINTQF